MIVSYKHVEHTFRLLDKNQLTFICNKHSRDTPQTALPVFLWKRRRNIESSTVTYNPDWLCSEMYALGKSSVP